MPLYAKFLKKILTNKRKINDNGSMALTEECNAIIQIKILPKLKDLGSFSSQCVIDKYVIDKALCDLEMSVSLMHLSFVRGLI